MGSGWLAGSLSLNNVMLLFSFHADRLPLFLHSLFLRELGWLPRWCYFAMYRYVQVLSLRDFHFVVLLKKECCFKISCLFLLLLFISYCEMRLLVVCALPENKRVGGQNSSFWLDLINGGGRRGQTDQSGAVSEFSFCEGDLKSW